MICLLSDSSQYSPLGVYIIFYKVFQLRKIVSSLQLLQTSACCFLFVCRFCLGFFVFVFWEFFVTVVGCLTCFNKTICRENLA